MRMMHMICSFLRHSKSLTHPEKMATCSNKRTNRYKEMLTSLYIHKGKKAYNQCQQNIWINNVQRKRIPSNKPGGDSQQKDPRDGLHANESHPTSLEVILNKIQSEIQTKTDGLPEWGSSGNGTGLSTVCILNILVEGWSSPSTVF